MVRTRGLLVTLGRGCGARVAMGLGNHGIQGFFTVEDLVRAALVDELPGLPFLTVMTTWLPA